MIIFDLESRAIKDTALNIFRGTNRLPDFDLHLVEFDDVRYRLQVTSSDPTQLLVSMTLPQASPEVVTNGGLPFGAVEALKEAYGTIAQLIIPSEKGYNLTLALNLEEIPKSQEAQAALASRIASIRSLVLGAPLREILKPLGHGKVSEDADALTALMHRPHESYFVIPQAEKVTIVFPMRFKDNSDVILATAFLQEFMEARRTGQLNSAPPCTYSLSPPLELKGAPLHSLNANAGFVSFVIFPHHVDPSKLERTAWVLSTFYAYVSYHVKCSKAFMHTRMRRRVDSLIQVLNRAKPEIVKEKKTAKGRTFKPAELS